MSPCGYGVLGVRILLSGAAGFIGGHLYKYLVDRGYDVVGIDNFSRPNRYILDMLRESGLDVLKVDVRNLPGWRFEEGFTNFIHLAAYIDVDESMAKPEIYFDNNVGGTSAALEYARRTGVEKFILASSAAVYGEPEYLPIDEGHPLRPLSPYGYSKVLGEQLLEMYSKVYGIDGIVLRIFNVYGPGQSGGYAGVISRFIDRVSTGEPPIIYGDGLQTRDFIHVWDVCIAFEKALTYESGYSVFNIASGKSISINELANLIIKLSGLDLEPLYSDARPGDIRQSRADISRAREALGFEPSIDLEEGIRRLLKEPKS